MCRSTGPLGLLSRSKERKPSGFIHIYWYNQSSESQTDVSLSR